MRKFKSCFFAGVFVLTITAAALLKIAAANVIPIKFNSPHQPILNVQIEKKKYWLHFDLGAKFHLSLSKNVLQNLYKKTHGKAKWKDCYGTKYETQKYLIPSMKIQRMKFENIIIKERSDEFIKNTTVWEDDKSREFDIKYVGSLGRAILKKTTLLLDFPDSKIVAFSKSNFLSKLKYKIYSFVKISFKSSNAILIEVETDLGMKKLILDTGSTHCYIRKLERDYEKYKLDECGLLTIETSKFVIAGEDYGEIILYPLEITDELKGIDGMLGMDFLIRHRVYIDYSNRMLYFEKASP